MMPSRVPLRPMYVAYNTRGLRMDLRDKLRVEATLRGISMEAVVNKALEAGLAVMEAQRIRRGRGDGYITARSAAQDRR